MFIDLETLPGPARYKLLTAAIVPRPIAWIVSRDARGTTNAPFSFFNLMSGDPPLICVGIGVRDGAPKDTARNIAERGEFTVNLVSSALASRMNVTAVDFPHGVDEAQEAGLLLAPGERVSVPRVAQSPVSFECRLHQLLRIDGRSLVIAEVAAMHARDDVVSDPERLYLDGSRMDLLARLHNPGWYCRPQADFQMPQLTREQWDEIKRDGRAENTWNIIRWRRDRRRCPRPAEAAHSIPAGRVLRAGAGSSPLNALAAPSDPHFLVHQLMRIPREHADQPGAGVVRRIEQRHRHRHRRGEGAHLHAVGLVFLVGGQRVDQGHAQPRAHQRADR